ncbi:MAG TPA: GMC family oxidoreductase [Allosphingosinicella sp.]|nr:GMC family oxidoreductase [Allosphingosinicella sp.]
MTIEAEHDYVVIGAGAAGSIVAAAAAAQGYSVLLLETGQMVNAGQNDVWDPTRWNCVLQDASFEFGFKSEPQKHLLPAGRVQNLLQSGGTGGCQIHNAMVYVRGGRSTYDHWAGALGCTGWDYASLEPLFAGIEARMGVITAVQDAFTQSVIDAGMRLGLPFNPDYNSGPTEYGCVPFQFTIEETGTELRRTTTYDKYIGASPPSNLTVATGCFVTRLIAGNGVPAVEILFQDELMTVQAGREVVLAAGAIMSPAILLRSGIGDAFALSKLGIDSVSDLPAVGTNFYDDLGCGLPVLVAGTFPPQPYGYLGCGMFACADGGAPPSPVNLELQISTSDLPCAVNPLPGQRYAAIGCSAMHLKSRGTVKLASNDPTVPPLIDPNWLSDPDDMENCLAALALAQAVASDALLAAQWQWTAMPIADPEDYIRKNGLTVQHYIGSCSMGPDRATAVVDPDLRVHGVDGLRVIDASVAPTPVTGNTAGVSMVIGAKGADLLLNG